MYRLLLLYFFILLLIGCQKEDLLENGDPPVIILGQVYGIDSINTLAINLGAYNAQETTSDQVGTLFQIDYEQDHWSRFHFNDDLDIRVMDGWNRIRVPNFPNSPHYNVQIEAYSNKAIKFQIDQASNQIDLKTPTLVSEFSIDTVYENGFIVDFVFCCTATQDSVYLLNSLNSLPGRGNGPFYSPWPENSNSFLTLKKKVIAQKGDRYCLKFTEFNAAVSYYPELLAPLSPKELEETLRYNLSRAYQFVAVDLSTFKKIEKRYDYSISTGNPFMVSASFSGTHQIGEKYILDLFYYQILK